MACETSLCDLRRPFPLISRPIIRECHQRQSHSGLFFLFFLVAPFSSFSVCFFPSFRCAFVVPSRNSRCRCHSQWDQPHTHTHQQHTHTHAHTQHIHPTRLSFSSFHRFLSLSPLPLMCQWYCTSEGPVTNLHCLHCHVRYCGSTTQTTHNTHRTYGT